MFLLGLVYYGGLEHPWPDVRILGVLQRLALCYLFTALLYLHLKPRVLVGVCIAILLAYWALFSFVPVPGTGVTSFAESSNWARYVDELLLPGHKHDGTWDNNGILSTLTSIATCLLGVFAALVINEPGLSQKKKVLLFVAGGLAMAACGWLWGLQFPVIKKIWTSSYVLVTGGYSFALLGAFFLVVDVWGYQKWAEPFIWIGANPLTIYMARNLMDFNGFAERFVGGSVALAVGPALAYFLKTAVSLLLSIVLVRFLYKKKIFLRV
jgi:predicted acyltransferase